MALYRRYRPQSFQDVIGQDHVTRPLMAALRADRTAHAYLFSGPRGCGKTTSARILARCLNCEEGPTDTPCGRCESCQELSLTGGGSLDVIEMDAASHGKVDDARELVERAAFAPARDRFKIFIIDEAHMVTDAGFNALLKLVEEPPPHIKFIFATTEPDKVIGTIRSRTHHYPFRLVPPDLLENYMAGICAEESVEVGGGVLSLVVRAGGGSVRDSLSVLDQLIGGTEDRVLSYEQAIALLGYTDGSLLDDAVEALAAKDGATLFSVVERVVHSGHEPRRFVEDLLQRLRDLIVISLAGESAGDVLASVPMDQYERMTIQAENLGERAASRAADLTHAALIDMVGATSPRLQLELLCARLLVTGNDDGAAQIQAPVEVVRAQPPEVRPAAVQKKAPAPSRTSPVVPGRKISPAWAAGATDTSSASPASSSPGPIPKTSAPERSTAEDRQVGSPEGLPDELGRSSAGGARSPQPDGADARASRRERAEVPAEEIVPVTEEEPKRPPQGSSDASLIRQRWSEVRAAIDHRSTATAALLDSRNMVIAGVREGYLGLEFRTHAVATTFNQGHHREVVMAALHDVLGLNLFVSGFSRSAPATQAQKPHSELLDTEPARGPRLDQPAQDGPRGGQRERAMPQREQQQAPTQEAANPARSGGVGTHPQQEQAPVQEGEHARPVEPGDLEARGLVLSTGDAQLVEGPTPTRDQLADQLRALEANQAARSAAEPDAIQAVDADPANTASAHDEGRGPGGAAPVAAQADADPVVPTGASGDPARSAPVGVAEDPAADPTANVPTGASGDPNSAASGSADAGDPAGILAPLVDGNAKYLDSGSVALPESADEPEPLMPSEPDAESVPPSGDIPFYAQRMPRIPPRPPMADETSSPAPFAAPTPAQPAAPASAASEPESVASAIAQPAPPSASRSAAPRRGPVFPIPQRPAPGGLGNQKSEPSVVERILADHGGESHGENSRAGSPGGWRSDSASAPPYPSGAPSPAEEYLNEEDEVSASDPTIEQSDLVGLDVVISTFDGAVIEEIPRETGGV